MRKAAIAAAVAAALAVAGCGNGPGGPTAQQIADNWCQTMWAKEQAWAKNFDTTGTASPATLRELAQSAMKAAEAAKGITCS